MSRILANATVASIISAAMLSREPGAEDGGDGAGWTDDNGESGDHGEDDQGDEHEKKKGPKRSIAMKACKTAFRNGIDIGLAFVRCWFGKKNDLSDHIVSFVHPTLLFHPYPFFFTLLVLFLCCLFSIVLGLIQNPSVFLARGACTHAFASR